MRRFVQPMYGRIKWTHFVTLYVISEQNIIVNAAHTARVTLNSCWILESIVHTEDRHLDSYRLYKLLLLTNMILSFVRQGTIVNIDRCCSVCWLGADAAAIFCRLILFQALHSFAKTYIFTMMFCWYLGCFKISWYLCSYRYKNIRWNVVYRYLERDANVK